MESLNYTANFSTCKQAYLEVKAFLEEETWDKVKSLSTKIENDLGCAGDDNYELIEKFVNKYNLDYEEFDYSKHFLSEGELFDAITPLYHLIMLPLWLIKVISLGKINLLPPKGYWHRETLDLAFGDMVAWYLTGKFNLRSNVSIKLAK